MMDVRTVLKNGPLLFDGAMGTLFAARPGCADMPCELASLQAPDVIASIHRDYLEAGARAIKTNTFGLTAWPDDQARLMLTAACRIAREAAAPYGALVFGDLGPAPQNHAMGESYIRQTEWFLQEGICCFLLETLPNDAGVREWARFVKQHAPESYLMVSFAVGPDGVTQDGALGSELLKRTRAIPEVDAVGFNCVSGPGHLLQYIQKLPPSEKPLSVMPNAGYPTVLGRRTVFMGTPDYFASQMAQIVHSGAAIIGGCCGTTPEHIRQTVSALRSQPAAASAAPAQPLREPRRPGRNPLAELLNSGKKVIAVELDPPVDDDISFFMEGVRALRDRGADAITIADCPVGRPRADSSLLACKIKRELGVEPLPHLTCRDRNTNATKALLLGLSMEDVHNVLLVTGDPIPTADRDEVKSVFNFNSRKLAQYVRSLNEEVLTTPFSIFGALNLNAANFEVQLRLAQEKEAAGMCGFLTQPVLSAGALANLKKARSVLHGKILGGIFPVVSHRNACFLNNEISGMHVCDEIVQRYEGLDRDAAEDLAVRISAEVARVIAPYVDGYYLMTPFKRVELMTRILDRIRA